MLDKTYVLKGRQEPDWLLVDATGQGIGRLATQIANYLLGKHKPTFTPGVEMGDVVVVINASNLSISQKRLDEKNYYKHSNYPGGLKTVNLRDQMRVHPDRVITAAVWGMLPHNRMGRSIFKRLKVYAGSEHPHAAQNPKPVV
ncbi:MAG: large subunit ribosomal protein L13 [Chloroflexi bacterium]|nr:MAG: large subunit ribosomal protein L13 [Chloroflexota bacterium]MBA4374611.1 50S ribosomal protein L13 [Anaerolinea sp.]